MEVYKIGVRLAPMTSNAAALMAVLIKDLTGANAKVTQLTGGFSKLKVAIGLTRSAASLREKRCSGLTAIIRDNLHHELRPDRQTRWHCRFRRCE